MLTIIDSHSRLDDNNVQIYNFIYLSTFYLHKSNRIINLINLLTNV